MEIDEVSFIQKNNTLQLDDFSKSLKFSDNSIKVKQPSNHDLFKSMNLAEELSKGNVESSDNRFD